jgi:tRNA (guanosine-2'-O-)-methyltransferase
MSSDAVSLYDVDLTQPVALVFGNEHSGVSDEARALADGNFVIPQMGVVQSLNISVACAVSLYEALRQRQRAGLYNQTALSEEDFAERLNDWYQR